MKHTLFILALITASIQTFAQSPRIKLNQITKDSLTGSVLISNLADSNMVYSRNFYINAADTSLVFFGTTIVAGGGGSGSFVTLPQLTDSLALYATKVQLSDSMATVLKEVATDLTLTGDGTGASPLKVDTSVIATVSALRDSLAGIISSVSTDVTLTGDGSVGNPLKVDTTTYIATKGDLNGKQDQLNGNGFVKASGTTITYDNSTYITGNQTITLSGDVTGSGTTAITATVVDDSHNHVISNVDNLQDSLNSRMVNDFSNASGTLPVANGGTGATSFTAGRVLFGNGTSAINTDGALFWDNSNKRLGIGTTSPSQPLDVVTGNNEGIVMGGTANSTDKEGGLLMRHYNTAEEDLNALFMATGSNVNNLFFGGGASGLNAATSIYFFTAPNNTTIGGTARMLVTSSGEVWIANLTDRGAYNLQVGGTGVWGAGAYVNGSDRLLKENIQSLNKGLDYIKKLNPVQYNYKSTFSSDQSKQLGFIAQDVMVALEDVSDAIVKDNGNYLSMAYQNLIPITVKAIQEQQSIIESIQTELDAKSSIIESQATEIEQLKTLITDLSNRLQILENN